MGFNLNHQKKNYCFKIKNLMFNPDDMKNIKNEEFDILLITVFD